MAAPSIPLTLRNVKGSEVTVTEGDNNFTALRSAIQQITVFTPAMFSILGNGTDETVKIQNMFNAAAGGIIICPAGLNFGFSAQIEIPQNTTILLNGSIFTRLTASTTHGFVIRENVSIDIFVVLTPGGSSGEKVCLITGSNVRIQRLSFVATAEGSFTSTNWGLEIDAGGSSFINNIWIGSARFKNYRTAIFAKRCSNLNVELLKVEFYRLAVFLQNVYESKFGPADIAGKSTTLTGDPGENGLLIESTTSSGASNNLVFNKWVVEDSGEHCFRLGGQLSINDVTFNECKATRPGRSITVGYPSSVEWHGGCGFKALGATLVTGQRHKNIYFNGCIAEDMSLQNGSFPAGHGINNFAGFQIVACDNVHLNSCVIQKTALQDYSAIKGFMFAACKGVYLNNCSANETRLTALNPYEEAASFAGWNFGVEDLYVNGGKYEVSFPTAGQGLPMYVEGINWAHSKWRMTGVNFYGGGSPVRYNSPAGAGTYSDMTIDFTYSGSNADDATTTVSLMPGATAAVISGKMPWRPSAPVPAALNASLIQDTLGGTIRKKTGGTWTTV
ncbi:hypothetical protein ORI99_00010 [Alishewanella sp. SMS9]|nr:hypothetical protein [Alishewanella sp. SMS9]